MIATLSSLIGSLLALLLLPGSLLLATLSLAALLPRRQPADPRPGETGPLAFVVPAHNEAASIQTTVNSLQAACRADGACSVWVIADNCSDNTAALARAAGVNVLERHDPTRRGKGYALESAFAALAGHAAEWLIVVDADSTLQPGFLPAMRRAMHSDRHALQACYLSSAGSHLRSRVSRIAQWGFNLVRPLGRQRLGLSAGLFGNGFALRRQLLERLPYRAFSVVEDLEYHLRLIEAGERVHFVADARVVGEIADSRDGARTQRSRWEGGRLRMLREHWAALLRQSLSGNRMAFEQLLDLTLLPLSLHVLLLATAAMLGGLGLLVAATGLLAIGLYLLALLWLGPTRPADLVALLLSPAYLLWKLTLLPITLASSGRQAAWIRSQRNKEHGAP